ncbi:MAG TPA: hypothetical protein VLN47_00025 [Clostridiaceae bacterium]|nr:hypothetical protein [Clostridiaceae bacterium]
MRIRHVVLPLLVLILLTGCGLTDSVGLSQAEPKIFTDRLENIAVTATTDWKEDGTLHEESILSLGNEEENAYLVVLMDGRDSFSEEMTIDLYSELASDATLDGLEDGRLTDEGEVNLGDKMGKKYILRGTIEGIRIAYLFYILEDPYNFTQVIIWSGEDNMDRKKVEYSGIIETFTTAY